MKAVKMVASFRKQVIIQNVTRVSDSQGGYTETWADTATVWASVEPVKAWEGMQAMQMQTPITHTVKMRYTSDITTASRLSFQDRILVVKEIINNQERDDFLTIKAVEKA